jgi:cation transport protein ChaC
MKQRSNLSGIPPQVDPLTRASLSADAVRRSIRKTNPDTYVWSDAELDASLEETLDQAPDPRDVWVFGYGSLLWNPVIHVTWRQPGYVFGYRRRFCMHAPTGRGTPEKPGLILALDAGGSCQGVALKVRAQGLRDELRLLWRREMVVGSYVPRWVLLHYAGTVKPVLTFVMNREHRSYRGALTPTRTASIIARASGVLGSNADYLFDTLDHLHAHGLKDKPLESLANRVRRIQKRTSL